VAGAAFSVAKTVANTGRLVLVLDVFCVLLRFDATFDLS
jgi:hypothetical protein